MERAYDGIRARADILRARRAKKAGIGKTGSIANPPSGRTGPNQEGDRPRPSPSKPPRPNVPPAAPPTEPPAAAPPPAPAIPPADPPLETSPTAPSGKRDGFGWGIGALVAIIGLGAGMAFGAFGPRLLDLFSSPSPSPTPSPSATAMESPEPFIETTRLTIPEGFTAEQIFARASETLGIPIEDFETAASDPDLIGLPPEADGNVEGWLGAFTYQVPETALAEDVLAEMIEATLMHLDNRGVAPEDRLEILTKASLIEKEVKRDEDRPKVARVIENRLADDMKLQFDSTVHYFVGASSVFTTAEDRAIDNPYNTYLYTGLPPGPICSPGLPSMDAALSPADGSWLYFVAINLDTGETAFATTYEEHQQNVEILRAWMAANPD